MTGEAILLAIVTKMDWVRVLQGIALLILCTTVATLMFWPVLQDLHELQKHVDRMKEYHED